MPQSLGDKPIVENKRLHIRGKRGRREKEGGKRREGGRRRERESIQTFPSASLK